MDFYLVDQETNDQLQLPVPPPELRIRRSKLYETVSIANLGEVDFTTGERISEISLGSFWPGDADRSYIRAADFDGWPEVSDKLDKWRLEQKPVRFIVTDSNINLLVLVAECDSSIKGGEIGDVYFDLTLRSYREVKVRTTAEKDEKKERPDTKPVPAQHEVKSGDSLYDVAKQQYGDGERWREIYELNKDTIGPDPDVIQPGQKLVLP